MAGPLDQISGALQGAVAWTFSPATLSSAGALTNNGKGTVTSVPANNDCLAKLDQKTDRFGPEGSRVVTRILILAGSLAVDPAQGNTLAFIGGATYRLGICRRDGIRSHWTCEVDNG